MPIQHLSDSFIRNLSLPNTRTEYYDDHLIENNRIRKKGVKGLALRITSTGKKSFVYRYWYDKKAKRYTIGSYPELKLSDAREKARKLHELVADGIDPLVQKKYLKSTKPKSLKDVIAEYRNKHLPTLKDSTRSDYERRIKIIQKGLGASKPIKDIQRFEVLDFLEEIARTAPVQAQRIQAVVSGIFTFALDREWVSNNIAARINLSGKRNANKKWKNQEFTDKQIKQLWNAFNDQIEPTRSFLQLLLILGQRSGETRRMKWEDIDFEKQLWTIPETDTKNSQIHYLPLPNMAFEILDQLRPFTGKSSFIFESPVKSGEPIGYLQKTAQRIRQNHGITDFNIHSLRTTAATRMAGLGTPPQVLSKILNHKKPGEGSTITAIYNKYDYEEEKRIALTRWSHELKKILTDTSTKIYRIGSNI